MTPNTNLERRVWDMFFQERRDTRSISMSLHITEAQAERVVNRELDARRALVDGARSVERLLDEDVARRAAEAFDAGASEIARLLPGG